MTAANFSDKTIALGVLKSYLPAQLNTNRPHSTHQMSHLPRMPWECVVGIFTLEQGIFN